MSLRPCRRSPLAILVCGAFVLAGCGKKGAPLPPLQRIPVAPTELALTRIDSEVFARFKVPVVNVDGVGPADVVRVELLAITAERPPEGWDPKELRELSTVVGSEQVRRPLPPPPPVKEGMAPQPQPPGPGVEQGSYVVLKETLTPEVHTPVALPVDRRAPPPKAEDPELPRPLVAPVESTAPRRYYYVMGVSARGRHSPPSAFASIPLDATSSAPSRPDISVEEQKMTLIWSRPPDARGGSEPTPPDLLPSKPIVAGPPPTRYDVFEVSKEPAPAETALAIPAPVTPAPVGSPEFSKSDITLGAERCFVVRPVDTIGGVDVRGPASPMSCASFADTFPPAAPGKLESIATAGMISLLWEPADSKDLAGYLVLRGEADNATLTPLTSSPIAETTYRDESVKAGARYIYAVVAVDKAGNRSAESNRVEETGK